MRQISFTLVHAIYYDGHALSFVPLGLVSMNIVMLSLLAVYNMTLLLYYTQLGLT